MPKYKSYVILLRLITILKLESGAMAIKKKIKRIRQAKENDSEVMIDSTEKELPRADVTDARDEKSKDQ